MAMAVGSSSFNAGNITKITGGKVSAGIGMHDLRNQAAVHVDDFLRGCLAMATEAVSPQQVSLHLGRRLKLHAGALLAVVHSVAIAARAGNFCAGPGLHGYKNKGAEGARKNDMARSADQPHVNPPRKKLVPRVNATHVLLHLTRCL